MTSSANHPTVVGFIGLGAMGLPMAENMVRGGARLVVCDTRREPLDVLGNRVTVVANARQVADQADIVFGCLPSMDAFRDVVLGADGLRHGKRMHTYVHLGTTGAQLVEEFVAALAPAMSVIDAPISGGSARARSGELTVIASGPKEAMEAAQPLMQHYARDIFVVSEKPGTAQVMKLVNNVMSFTNLAIACEAMLVGAKAGLDPAVMVDVLNCSTGQNSATMTKVPLNMLTGNFDYGAALQIILKDSKGFLDAAKAVGIDPQIARMIHERYEQAAREEGPDADMTTVIRPMERAASFKLPVPGA